MAHTRWILLVDDDPNVRSLMRALLEREGYSVVECSEGEQAARVFKERKGAFDLVISDVVMPGITGVQLCQQLRRISGGVAVILVTGYADSCDGEGFDVLLKPFSVQEFIRRVRKVFETSPPVLTRSLPM